MHEGNISFFAHGALCIGVAPAYDMLPMFFAPRMDAHVYGVVSESTQFIRNVQPWTSEHYSTSTAGSAVESRYTKRDQEAAYSVMRSVDDWVPPNPSPIDSDIWPTALEAALDFWQVVSNHQVISGEFKEIAQRCAEKLTVLESLVALLPRA